MSNLKIYGDISKRTSGDIYLGVVGPVRAGKSTFIKKFMECMVLPRMESSSARDRATDELPQSASGKTIMTTEPKFIPEQAVFVKLDEATSFYVRLIDCVGYIVPTAIGYIENNQPRMVMTPWYEQEIPFNMAAELGTRRVIEEHSTIGIVVTTDGSITDIPREEYAEAEERVIAELKALGKPFVVLLNCVYPNSEESAALASELTQKYGVPVTATSCVELNEEKILNILKTVLYEFPIKQVAINIPAWLLRLPAEHRLRRSVIDSVKLAAGKLSTVRSAESAISDIALCEEVEGVRIANIDLGTGSVIVRADMDETIFYKVLSEETGLELNSQEDLMPCMLELCEIRRMYEKIKGAMEEVAATGYGIVMPTLSELSLEKPEIVRQGGRYGVRLRASAPSIHMMKADITTEVSPIVGSEKQSEELVHYLLKEFEETPEKIWESNIFGKSLHELDITTEVSPIVGSEKQSEELVHYLLKEFEETPEKIWESNIFGKSLHELVNEGLHGKLYRMPQDARIKLQETLERIINEGCSGLICIIL